MNADPRPSNASSTIRSLDPASAGPGRASGRRAAASALLLVATAALAACGGSGGSPTPPPVGSPGPTSAPTTDPASIEHATGALDVVFQFEQGGGFVPIGFFATQAPQFTLYGDARKGRRPGYSDAAAPEDANRLYEHFVECLRPSGLPVVTGVFRAMMDVALTNQGPVTLLLDSRKAF